MHPVLVCVRLAGPERARAQKQPDDKGDAHESRLARTARGPSAAGRQLLRLEVDRLQHRVCLGQEAVELGLGRGLDRHHQHAIAE